MDGDSGEFEAPPVFPHKARSDGQEECQYPEPGHSDQEKCDKMSLDFILNPCTSSDMQCLMCPRTFASGSKLRAHVRNAHTPKPTIQCPHCYKAFTGFKWLLSHIAVSTLFTTLIGDKIVTSDLTNPSVPTFHPFLC